MTTDSLFDPKERMGRPAPSNMKELKEQAEEELLNEKKEEEEQENIKQ